MIYEDKCYTKSYINPNIKQLQQCMGRTGIVFMRTWQTVAKWLNLTSGCHMWGAAASQIVFSREQTVHN
jgi:hypothetical protein